MNISRATKEDPNHTLQCGRASLKMSRCRSISGTKGQTNQWHFRSRNRPAINYMFWRSKYNPILQNNSIPHNYNSRVILFWELFVLMYLLTRWKTVPCIFLSFVQMRCHLIKWHAKIGGLLPYVFVKLWETVPKKAIKRILISHFDTGQNEWILKVFTLDKFTFTIPTYKYHVLCSGSFQ